MSPYRLKQIPFLQGSTSNRDKAELAKLTAYIDGIEDALTRKIFIARYVDRCSWAQVAQRVGGGNTENGVRVRHNRYLRTH